MIDEAHLLRSPLHDDHCAIKARMVPFAGWEMPLQYAGALAEHHAVREHVGLFDISHMGRLYVSGHGALSLLDRLTTNSVASLDVQEAQYNLLCRADGSTVDDILIYRLPDRFLVVVNASNRERDIQFLQEHAGADVHLDDVTLDTAMVALQGPLALEMLAHLGNELHPPRRYHYSTIAVCASEVFVGRTGYTGEDGVEMIVPADGASVFWRHLVQDLGAYGGQLCGLAARDTLRLEAGLPLYGHELDDHTTPVSANLTRFIAFDKGEFLAREALLEEQRRGPQRVLVGLRLETRALARQGFLVMSRGSPVGVVTSGAFSPTLRAGIALAYVSPEALNGDGVYVVIRGQEHKVQITQLPFYRRSRLKMKERIAPYVTKRSALHE